VDEVLARLSNQSGLRLSAQGSDVRRPIFALSLQSVPLRDVLDGILMFYPNLRWEKTDDGGLILRNQHNPRFEAQRNLVYLPHSDDEKEIFKQGSAFMRGLRNASPGLTKMLEAAQGVRFRNLPSDLQHYVRAIFAAEQHRKPNSVVTLDDLTDANVTWYVKRGE